MNAPQEDITQTYLSVIERELKNAVKQANICGDTKLHDMLAYHMGWLGKPIISEARGKRFRPLLVLLTCSAAGGDWMQAIPAAVAVELVHNFSLVHDDIEDKSHLRRGRPTVWKKWGIPQAINAGDAMFTMAHLQLLHLSETLSHSSTLQAIEILQQACLQLTQGQYLDLSYEKRSDVTVDDYWMMIDGKTAALISASTQLGALSAYCDAQVCDAYRSFGRSLGLAFQVQDDFLGIWGNAALTGKSNQSDLITKKKTLPILFGLSNSEIFKERWNQGPFLTEELDELIKLLETTGAKSFTQAKANELINQAIRELDDVHQNETAYHVLISLALNLIHRQL
jgi:geranylgeranyl diphosphate synthase, type I